MAYKIHILTKAALTIKLSKTKIRYEEYSNMGPQSVKDYLKQIIDTNIIPCRGCNKPLNNFVGKKIVMNKGIKYKYWFCVPCGKKKNLI